MKPLVRFLRRLWCWLVGHDWDEDALTYYGEAYCQRCQYQQQVGSTEPGTLLPWLRNLRCRAKWRLRDWWLYGAGASLRVRLFSRCPCCDKLSEFLGRPVGDHKNCDDIPF
jgi:hypothetical protein